MSNYNEITTLQYMGSKSRILDAICNPILENKSIDTVIDLFAGTGTVGYALKPHYSIISNDLEYYAYILNEGILNGCNLPKSKENKIIDTISDLFGQISACCQNSLDHEQKFFNTSRQDYLEYRNFCDYTPSVVQKEQCAPYLSDILDLVNQINLGAKVQDFKLPILFVTYYSNTYFGIRQCCEIDAIRGAISSISQPTHTKCFINCANDSNEYFCIHHHTFCTIFEN